MISSIENYDNNRCTSHGGLFVLEGPDCLALGKTGDQRLHPGHIRRGRCFSTLECSLPVAADLQSPDLRIAWSEVEVLHEFCLLPCLPSRFPIRLFHPHQRISAPSSTNAYRVSGGRGYLGEQVAHCFQVLHLPSQSRPPPAKLRS